MSVAYTSGSKTFHVKTPTRKRTIKQLVRHSYKPFSASVVDNKIHTKDILYRISHTTKGEIKKCADTKGSFIKGELAALQNFNWESMFVLFEHYMPTLLHFLKLLIPNSQKRKPLVCTIALQILKNCYSKMSLFQQAVSLLLYGNSTKKKVLQNAPSCKFICAPCSLTGI